MKIIISEKQYDKLNESINDGDYGDRWHHERAALKKYLVNFGQPMISRENGKLYKVLYDTFLSSSIGINYCICIQWNSQTNEPGEVIYVRAYDKFRPI